MKYFEIEKYLNETVEKLADRYYKTVRGVKCCLTRRGLSCANYRV